MKIFISGATGYIGNELAKKLAEEGHTIHALYRSENKKSLLNHPGIEVFEGEITDSIAVEKAMEGCAQAYHLAAYARVWAKDPAVFYRINVEGTRIILDSAKKFSVQKIVVTSTAGVLGPSGHRPVKEDDPRIGNIFNEYEHTKTQAEALCREYCSNYNMNIVIVNPPRVYGPGILSESNAVTRMMRLYLKGKWKIIPGDGKKTGSYVYIDDVVNGHKLAMERGRRGERYLLSGVNASYIEFFDLLAKIRGKEVRLYHFPVWVMMASGYAMMAYTKLTLKPPLLTPQWIKKYFYDWSFSCEKAKTELGYTYISLEEGLRKTVEWIEQQDDPDNV